MAIGMYPIPPPDIRRLISIFGPQAAAVAAAASSANSNNMPTPTQSPAHRKLEKIAVCH